MGKFVVHQTATGHKFDLKAGNGEIIASSQVYASLDTCLKGVESVRTNAAIANLEDLTDEKAGKAINPKFELYEDKSGEFRFRLKAKNGQVIATSEGYKAKKSCLNGIESVRKNAGIAVIEKVE